jgi:cobalt-zinc-cadmium efflux system outer membrane protein
MRWRRGAGALVLVGAGLAGWGCAKTAPERGAGFDGEGGVREEVLRRTGMKVHWRTGTPEDAQAADAVASLLERELSVEGAVQVALLNNRGLQAVYEDLELAQAEVVQAGLLKNPVFSGEVRFATSGGEGPAVVLDVAQDFVGLLSMPLRKGRAEAEFAAAKARVTGAVVDMAARVRVAFYEYQACVQVKEMRAAVLSAFEASYELARRVHSAGNSRELDVLNERDVCEQARMDLAVAEDACVQARERVNGLMGVWGMQTRWRGVARLPELPADDGVPADLERRAVESNLDLVASRREIEVAARTLGIVEPLGWLTEMDVGVAAERELEGTWSVGPSVSVPIPLFDQGQGATGRAMAELRREGERYYARGVEVRSGARAAGAAVEGARSRARYYERVIVPLRERIVEQTQLQYNAMQASAFQLLEAKRHEIEAGAAWIEAVRDYWVARARLEQVLCGRLGETDAHERVTQRGSP